jgi:hypothetical protein
MHQWISGEILFITILKSGNIDFENYMPTMQETYVVEMKRTLTTQQIQQQQHPLVKAIVVDTSGG